MPKRSPVRAIADDPEAAYDYTSKGNLVAVISNGTAILGLGDLGPLASKPVMEGKSVLFKRFADVDSVDVEVASRDPDEIITVIKNIGATYGGINLEDIKSPECFRIETELQELLDIPVFHDDQHGTAIISAAGLINACAITGRKLEDVKLVLCGAGFGIFASPNNRLMMNAVPRERSGSAGGIIATARTLGQTVGAALVALVFSLFDFSNGGPVDAARAALWLAAGFAATALVVGSLRLRH